MGVKLERTLVVVATDDGDGAQIAVEHEEGNEYAELDKLAGNLPIRLSIDDVEAFATALQSLVTQARGDH